MLRGLLLVFLKKAFISVQSLIRLISVWNENGEVSDRPFMFIFIFRSQGIWW